MGKVSFGMDPDRNAFRKITQEVNKVRYIQGNNVKFTRDISLKSIR